MISSLIETEISSSNENLIAKAFFSFWYVQNDMYGVISAVGCMIFPWAFKNLHVNFLCACH